MIKRSKSKLCVFLVVFLCLTLLVGCGNSSSSKNNTNNAVNNNNQNSSNDGNTSNSSTSNTSSKNNNSSNSNTNNTNKSQGQNNVSSQSVVLLNNIYALSKEGKVPECEFICKTNILDDVIKKWGNPDKQDYAGEGRYAVYSSKKIHFGVNKGEQIFDVRSFKDNLKIIKYNDVEKTLGKPSVINKTNTENILIYDVNKTYQLMLIFPKPTDTNKNPSLDHISVYSPADAKNNMAG
ncbi:YjgB family protein [Clostridium sp. C8-1-8]|uniref:YjgB family protein n=1 Tax=Clostridium sp. C8-1-8 TaxID=2698831 RepID=UPI00136915EA|nr:YjgB family protein [Clostridium sp. C8-1-8]